ncbi:hypothetical protein EJ110_NYTH53301 [Nymphaea thermarum]|nr:hypothetical protein EJ110_NYTH53301 [Nymphaea thermarum]
MAGRRPPETGRFWPVSPFFTFCPFSDLGGCNTREEAMGRWRRVSWARPATATSPAVDLRLSLPSHTVTFLFPFLLSPATCNARTQGSDRCRWVVAGGRRLNGDKSFIAHPASNVDPAVPFLMRRLCASGDCSGSPTAMEDCLEWKEMRRAYSGVWDMANPPRGSLNLRLQVSGEDGQKPILPLGQVIPGDWKCGAVYDSNLQLH